VLCLLRLRYLFYCIEHLFIDLSYPILSVHVGRTQCTVENSVEEVLIELMAEKVMSIGIQASSTRGVQASPSTARGSRPSRAVAKKRTKHRDDLENAKLIPSILPDYIPPLADTVNHDSVPRDFDYTLVTAYLPKGIHTGKPQPDKIMTLKINDFNLGDHKNFNMLSPHRYLTRTKGKKSRIIPQPWTMDLAQSTILNVMKIPHFGRHQEVNACIKLLLSSFHGRLFVARQTHHHRPNVDPSDHRIEHAGTRPTRLLPREGCRPRPGTED
jgi:hypothetical protein